MTTHVAYYRVSTQRQGNSGLGLEAQQTMVAPYKPVRSYTEIESGKKSDRPELMKALADCKRTKSTLVIAKMDRLSRNTRFLLTLIENDVDVVFCDLPQVPAGAMGKFFLTQMAAIAELEAGLISERTKAALAECKKRGMLLGSARPGAYRLKGGANPVAAKRAGESSAQRCRDAYADLKPLLAEWRAAGLSWAKMAARLTAEGYKTRQGKQWGKMQVKRVYAYV